MHKCIHKVLQSKWTPRCFCLVVIVYAISMAFLPAIRSGGDLAYVMAVWDRWQAFNVGIMALSASAIAFYFGYWRVHEERLRKNIAARALLPLELSDLTEYCRECMTFLNTAWEVKVRHGPVLRELEVPNLDHSYAEVFKECIESAEPVHGEAMARVLSGLQVNDARLREIGMISTNTEWINVPSNALLDYIYALGLVHADLGRLFDYARMDKEYDDSPLSAHEASSVVRLSHFRVEEFEGLSDVLDRRLGHRS